jgi:sugar phosphate isomerase/epimerase
MDILITNSWGGLLLVESIGLQVYSVHEDLFRDFYGTLKNIAEIGYKTVELLSHNFFSNTRFSDLYPAKSLKEKLNSWDLKPISSHEIMAQGKELSSYDWDSIIRYHVELECPRVVIPWQWFLDREESLRAAEQIDIIGRTLKKNGLQLYYHNHAHEFLPINGTTPFDILVENTDPSHLKFQLEVAFVQLVGLDPISLVKKLGNRCDMIHQTDISRMAQFQRDCFFQELVEYRREGQDIMKAYENQFKIIKSSDLGKGEFNYHNFYSEIKETNNLKYIIVENETTVPGKLESVAKDLQFMRSLVSNALIS